MRAKDVEPMLLAVHNFHPNTFPENFANIDSLKRVIFNKYNHPLLNTLECGGDIPDWECLDSSSVEVAERKWREAEAKLKRCPQYSQIKEESLVIWDVASLVSVPLQEERPFKTAWEVNEWMKTGDIPEFSRDTKLEDEMTGAAFLAFVTNLRVFLSKKGIPLNQVLVVNLTSNFDGVRMFNSSTTNGEVYIWYSKIVQLKELSTKEENSLILVVLERRRTLPSQTIFSFHFIPNSLNCQQKVQRGNFGR